MYYPQEVLDRFWSKVNKTDICWLWKGAIGNGTGYGMFRWINSTIGAHRASWMIHNGMIPIGLYVLHRCVNRMCVRPDHLFLGTQADNVLDCMVKGRAKKAIGVRVFTAKLTDDQVREIRRLAPQMTRATLASQFGVDASQISRIVHRQFWTHI